VQVPAETDVVEATEHPTLVPLQEYKDVTSSHPSVEDGHVAVDAIICMSYIRNVFLCPSKYANVGANST
jgi:hypothetical protein